MGIFDGILGSVLGGVLGGSSASSGQRQQQLAHQSQSMPWSGVAPFAQQLYGWGQHYGTSPPEYFPGATLAPQSDWTQTGLNNLYQSAQGQSSLLGRLMTSVAGMLPQTPNRADYGSDAEYEAAARSAYQASIDPTQNEAFQNVLTTLADKYGAGVNAMSGDLQAAFKAQSGMMGSQFDAQKASLETLLSNMVRTQEAEYNQYKGDVTDTLQNEWLPAVNAGALGVGGLGGSRQALAQSKAVDMADKNMLHFSDAALARLANTQDTGHTNLSNLGAQQAAALAGLGGQHTAALSGLAKTSAANLAAEQANMSWNAYSQNVNNQMGLLQMAPNLMQMVNMPAMTQLQAGALRDARSQAEIDDARARWDFYQGYPMSMGSWMSNLFGTSLPMQQMSSESPVTLQQGGGFNLGFDGRTFLQGRGGRTG